MALGEAFALGELVVVTEAIAEGGSGAALGVARGEAVHPDSTLTERLSAELGTQARPAPVSSFDVHPETSTAGGSARPTCRARRCWPALDRLGSRRRPVLIVAETADGGQLEG